MTSAYEAPDRQFAEMVHRVDAESERQTKRLEHASAEELKSVVRDRSESNIARGTALLVLMCPRDPEWDDLLLELFDDPDQDLWRMAITSARLSDPRIRTKLLSLLDDPDDQNWSEAAIWLARSKEESLLTRFVDWLERGDEGHRNVAVECLNVLKTPAAQAALQGYWESGQGNDDVRLEVAGALLGMGDHRGRNLLETVAQRAEGVSSVVAATLIYLAEPGDGLSHMRKILDDGDLKARQMLVGQIRNFTHLPHAFTADGLSEARVWVQTQLENPDAMRN